MKFRAMMLDVTNVDPFSCITIAFVCMKVFKTQMLTEDWVYKMSDGSIVKATRTGGDDVTPKLNGVKPEFVQSPIAKVPAGGILFIRRIVNCAISGPWSWPLRHHHHLNVH